MHLSDIHSDPEVRLEKRLPNIVRLQEPDLILFTGDAVNSEEARQVFASCLEELVEIAPVLSVRGNWDVWRWGHLDLLRTTGAQHLDGRAQQIDVEGARLWIAGIDVGSESKLESLLSSAPVDIPSILLYHTPDLADRVAGRVDLYLAGHTHGGQIAMPGYGALVTMSRFGKRFEAGRYELGGTTLYVNRGIGMMGGAAPRMRFWSRPEVTVIRLLPNQVE